MKTFFVDNGVSNEFPSESCIWQKWIIYPNTRVRVPQRGGAQCNCIGCMGKGRPWHLITLWVSNEEMHTSGLHNSESWQGQIDQHKFTGWKCLFRCSVEVFLKYNYLSDVRLSQYFCNWESFCQPHVYCGLHFLQAWYKSSCSLFHLRV